MIRSVEAGDYIPKSSEEGRRAIAIYRADSIQRNLAAAASDYAAAVAAEDWRVLDYDSVATWAADVLGQKKFTVKARQEVAALLLAAGHTVREIAEATGVSTGTAAGDAKAACVQELNTTPGRR
jgi:hypothetical protein